MKQRPSLFHNKLFPIFLITFLDQVAITLCFPVLTFICFDQQSALFSPATSHAIRSYWFGIFSAIPHLVPMITAPLLGSLSDIFGRKKLLMFGAGGIIVYGFFSSLGILFSSIALFIIAFLANGICVRTEPIATAVVSDCSDNNNKFVNIGYLQFFISIGAIIGPLLGGYLIHSFYFETLNFSLPYLTCIALGALTVLATFFIFNETNSCIESNKNRFRDIIPELLNKKILHIVLILFFTQAAWRIYYQFVPPILKITANYSGTQVGTFMGVIALWLALASSVGINLFNRYLDKKKIFWCCVGLMSISLIMILATFYINNSFFKTILIWLSAIPIATGDVIIYSMISALLLNIISKGHHGKIIGISFIIISITWSATGLIGGILFAMNIQMPFVLALISLLSIIGLGLKFVLEVMKRISRPNS